MAVAMAVVVAGCDATTQPERGESSFAGPAVTLRLLASDDLAGSARWAAPFNQAREHTGVTVRLTPAATRAAADQVVSGRANGHHDAVWLDSAAAIPIAGTLPGLRPAGQTADPVERTDRIASSPVVLGLATGTTERLGWNPTTVSWADFADACAAGQLSFGMGDPDTSAAGLAALIAVATAVSGGGAALTPELIPGSTHRLRGLFSAQALKSDSTAALLQTFADSQDAAVPGPAGPEGSAQPAGPTEPTGPGGTVVQALVETEAALADLSIVGRQPGPALRQPLTVVYPSDGTLSTDLTMSLLTSADAAAREGYRRLVGYLRSVPVQRTIMDTMALRPANPAIDPAGTFPVAQPFRLPFPDRAATITDLTAAYRGSLRRPARIVYLLDVSGSMEGDRLAQVRAAFAALTDPAAAGSQPTIQPREQVTIVPFRAAPENPVTFDVPDTDPGPRLAEIRQVVDGLTAGGWTGIYDALEQAYSVVEEQSASGEQRITSIVLLTDGENTRGDDAATFEAAYRALPAALRAVPVFPVLFGDADRGELDAVATLTGGRLFDGTGGQLSEAFAAIRASQ